MNSTYSIVQLCEVLTPIERRDEPIPGQIYRQVGVRLWGQGAYEREAIDGGQTQYKTLNRVEFGDIIVNKIWARNGSVSVVWEDTAGCYASSEFPLFIPDTNRLEPKWIYYLTKTPDFWHQCEVKSFGTSGKNRIRPEKFLEIEIPLPALDVQRRIIAYIEGLVSKATEVQHLIPEINQENQSLLLALYYDLIKDVQYLPMVEVAPIVRRPVEVEPEALYYELGIRSFGNGTFHKPPITGFNLGTKRIFWIQPSDLLFSNVFAWEGAIAVVKPEDDGHVGSHRFISCVPKHRVATPSFLCFHFLTPEGLQQIREASPGGAGRNRTLGLGKLERIHVPVPPYEKQLWFDKMQSRINTVKGLRAEISNELDALLASVLDKAFKGEL